MLEYDTPRISKAYVSGGFCPLATPAFVCRGRTGVQGADAAHFQSICEWGFLPASYPPKPDKSGRRTVRALGPAQRLKLNEGGGFCC